jgi:hypothetical protein
MIIIETYISKSFLFYIRLQILKATKTILR